MPGLADPRPARRSQAIDRYTELSDAGKDDVRAAPVTAPAIRADLKNPPPSRSAFYFPASTLLR